MEHFERQLLGDDIVPRGLVLAVVVDLEVLVEGGGDGGGRGGVGDAREDGVVRELLLVRKEDEPRRAGVTSKEGADGEVVFLDDVERGEGGEEGTRDL